NEVHPSTTVAGLPTLVNRYEVLDLVAQGAQGIVYKVRDLVLDRIVALKTLRSGVLAAPSEIQRFQNEARAVAALNHANIVAVHDFGEIHGAPDFTMDYVPGGTLSIRMAEFRQASPKRAVALMEKIARAVHAAHEHHIVHRDLKPTNILIDENGEPRLSD